MGLSICALCAQAVSTRGVKKINIFIFFTILFTNLCVAYQVCTYCIDVDDIQIVCGTCGVREFVFNREPVKQLLDLCVRGKTDFTEIVCIPHNARAFDSQFILKELVENSEHGSPCVILSGHNITLLKYGRTKFIDIWPNSEH